MGSPVDGHRLQEARVERLHAPQETMGSVECAIISYSNDVLRGDDGILDRP